MACFVNKPLLNVGGELSKLVPGRVSTEVDARHAYDTHAIVGKVESLLRLYNRIDVPPERLLFKIPATWQGIEASRLLESEGIQSHMTFVFRFSQEATVAQTGATEIQIFVVRLKDWTHNHNGDSEIEAALKRGEDPGLALVTKSYNYIHKYGNKSKLMVVSIRNKQDIFNFLAVDYIITPLKILQTLKESVTPDDDKYTFVKILSSQLEAAYNFTNEEMLCLVTLEKAVSLKSEHIRDDFKNTFFFVVIKNHETNWVGLLEYVIFNYGIPPKPPDSIKITIVFHVTSSKVVYDWFKVLSTILGGKDVFENEYGSIKVVNDSQRWSRLSR